MPDDASVWSFAVVAFLVVVSAPAITVAHDRALTTVEQRDRITMNTSAPVALDANASRFAPTVTVRNSSGVILQRGEDYDFNATSGELDFFDTPSVTAGSQARVTFGAVKRTEVTEAVYLILASLVTTLGVFVLVQALRAIIAYLTDRNPLSGSQPRGERR
jgi:hypothetical protein